MRLKSAPLMASTSHSSTLTMEALRAWRKNGYSSLFIHITTWLKPIRKIIQFLPHFKKQLFPSKQPVTRPEVKKQFTESSVEEL